jgi:ureidoglycolate lyase
VALQPSRFVVVVAESDPATKLPDIATARAFLADQVAGIVYRPGVWHAGMMVLEAAASFFVVQGLVESGNDATAPLPQPMVIVDPTRPQ